MGVVGLILAGAGLLIGWMGNMQRNGTLKRNPMMGIRIPSTMASDEAWDAGHRAAAATTIASGGVLLVGGLAVVAMGPSAAGVGIGITTVATVVLTLLSAVQAHRAAKAVGPSDPRRPRRR